MYASVKSKENNWIIWQLSGLMQGNLLSYIIYVIGTFYEKLNHIF